jgi:hypothetical protein
MNHCYTSRLLCLIAVGNGVEYFDAGLSSAAILPLFQERKRQAD